MGNDDDNVGVVVITKLSCDVMGYFLFSTKWKYKDITYGGEQNINKYFHTT